MIKILLLYFLRRARCTHSAHRLKPVFDSLLVHFDLLKLLPKVTRFLSLFVAQECLEYRAPLQSSLLTKENHKLHEVVSLHLRRNLRVIYYIQPVAMKTHAFRDRPFAVDAVSRLGENSYVVFDIILELLLHNLAKFLGLL